MRSAIEVKQFVYIYLILIEVNTTMTVCIQAPTVYM